jgi:aminoglycoside phosphotransferase (APT) family kinase protein
VLRICPQDFQLFMDPRLGDQVRLLKALHARGRVKVAQPIVYEPGCEPFGQPYFIMDRLEGRVPVSFPPYNSGGFLFEATVAQRRTLWESAVDQLAEVARTPLADVAFLAEADGDGDFEQNLQWWFTYARWAGVAELPALAQLQAWLEANRPADPPPGLSWGDARIGNMMFADDFTVAGVMDWEQLSLGGALLDMGWWLYFDRFHSDGLGLKRLEGLGDRAETIARWEGVMGLKVSDIEWYEMLAGYKLAVITGRKVILEKNAAPSNNPNSNIITQLNARLQGWSAPEDMLG